MNTGHDRLVINNLVKALVAEEKQGFTNTGVMGGFDAFLRGIIPRLQKLLPGHDYELLGSIANQYAHWSPLQRREGFARLRSLVEDLGRGLTPLRPVKQVAVSQVDQPQPCRGALQFIKGVGPERARQLQSLGINTVEEMLLYYPRRYEDRRQLRIEELHDGQTATITGIVIAGNIVQARKKVIKLSIKQGERIIIAVWFNQVYILQQYPVGSTVTVTGKVRWQQANPELMATDIEKTSSSIKSADIMPVYSENGRVSSKVIRGLMTKVLDQVETHFPEIMPPEMTAGWMGRAQAHREIHFPESHENLNRARERLVWEEILFLQLAMARLGQGGARSESPALNNGQELVGKFLKELPFILTKAQQRVIGEILRDMAGTATMTRLVQGDVGSGKTAVAMAALLQAVGSGYQGAMMAPTEILAWQHYQSLQAAFAPLGVHVAVILGSQNRSEREETLAQIASGQAQVVIGTHALIQENVSFQNLGLVVTDEQHRFGVRQRSKLQSKGENPHVLVLTATPIPRTLALTLYGDLQLSVLDELPAGRKPILTRKLSERGRPNLEKFMDEQMAQGRQIYVVCPLVEESESLDLSSASQRASALQESFPGRNVALLHGKMKGSDKEKIMSDFQKGIIDILVATTVVEVGVNVPNATIMVIESPERFGLAQLHQLRGRVGRGSDQSYCLLMTQARDSRRLDILCQTQDGFKIAEEDMRLRGPGDLLGTRQHGLAELRLADLTRDGRLVEKAYQAARQILANPQQYQTVWQAVDKIYPLDKIGMN